MATKKFAQMSTKKLNALLENASEEDAVAIKAILESREAAKAAEEPAAMSAELSPEEQAAIAAAESGEAETEEKPKKEKKVRVAAEKMSMEELDAKTEECKVNVNHRCSVLLNGTAIRVDGTITGVLKDKRAMQVYYAIQTDECEDAESKKMYKKHDAEDLTILDEVVEVVKAKKQNSTARARKEKMTDEEWAAERDTIMELAGANVGKKVVFDEDSTGVIVGILVDKRSCGLYYRIEIDADGIKKVCHKVITATKDEETMATVLVPLQGMAEELDEEGQKLNEAYQERKAREPRKTLSPEEKVLKAEEDVKKAEATLTKAQETLTMRKNALEVAKKELENMYNAQEANVTGQGVEGEGDDDLS